MLKKMKFLLIIIMVLIFNQIIFSEETKSYTIGVQAIPDYLPESQYKNGKYSGFGRELFELFGEEYGYNFVLKPLPIKRLYNDFVSENVDFKYPDNSYWSANIKKGKEVIYSDPIVSYIDGIMVLPENLEKGLSKLKRIATPLGYTPFPYLKMIDSGDIKLMENSNFRGLFRAVIYGVADGAYVNIAVGNHYMNEIYKEEKLVFNTNLPHTKSTRHFSTIKYPEVIKQFNEFLINEKEKVEALKKKHKIENF